LDRESPVVEVVVMVVVMLVAPFIPPLVATILIVITIVLSLDDRTAIVVFGLRLNDTGRDSEETGCGDNQTSHASLQDLLTRASAATATS
jgi:hypothetical protein